MLKHLLHLVLFLSITACGAGYQVADLDRDPNNRQCALFTKYENLPPFNDEYLAYDDERKVFITPTRILKPNEWPQIVDDLKYEGMELAIGRQLERFKRMNLKNKFIKFGNKKYPLSNAPKSLERFRELVADFSRCQEVSQSESCEGRLIKQLKKEFNMFKPKLAPDDPRYGHKKQTLFTAYYTPLLNGKMQSDGHFKHAIYNNPGSKELLKKSRVEIDFENALSNKGLELAYTPDLFDLYLLHVQGGGRVVTEGGNDFYISYDGTNGQSWRFISHYMYDKGYISNKGIPAQKKFLKENPDKQAEIYNTCPSYVFFKKSNRPPLGNDNVSLTDNRSIATDTNYYKFKGLLSFVEARRPVEKKIESTDTRFCSNISFTDYSRFYLDQDTGGAIRGKARVDLYAGEGSYAELSAYNTKEVGNLYFLFLK